MPNWVTQRLDDMGATDNVPEIKTGHVTFAEPLEDGSFPELPDYIDDDSDDEIHSDREHNNEDMLIIGIDTLGHVPVNHDENENGIVEEVVIPMPDLTSEPNNTNELNIKPENVTEQHIETENVTQEYNELENIEMIEPDIDERSNDDLHT